MPRLTKAQRQQNADRAARGENLLRQYAALVNEEDALRPGDLIADLLHYAHREGGDANVDAVLESARLHFTAERNGED